MTFTRSRKKRSGIGFSKPLYLEVNKNAENRRMLSMGAFGQYFHHSPLFSLITDMLI